MTEHRPVLGSVGKATVHTEAWRRTWGGPGSGARKVRSWPSSFMLLSCTSCEAGKLPAFLVFYLGAWLHVDHQYLWGK